MPHNIFGGGGTANIAKTNKQELLGHSDGVGEEDLALKPFPSPLKSGQECA
jgi:hypothetical protein